MADSVSTFTKRVISALLGGLLVLGIGYYGGTTGLYIICTVAIVLGIREYSRMAFLHWRMPTSVSYLFWFTSVLFYAAMVEWYEFGLTWFALVSVLFIVGCLWLTRGKVTNDNLMAALAAGMLGMIYCVLLPNFAVQTIKLDHGSQWFLFLLLVVFFGDTFAYFGGRFFGGHKFMPAISPNKTWEGSLAGLLGSALAGTVHVQLVMPGVAWWKTAVFCIACGFAAQSGDLLMSLVKRVAQVKDSGHIMPGHGGILDRLDGIFIACPLVYGFAIWVA